MALPNVFAVLGWFLAGGAVEAINTFLRKWSVSALGSHRSPQMVLGLVGGFVLRLLGTALVLMVAFTRDFAFGWAALMGYWVCRWVMLWRVHRRLSLDDNVSG
jgi:hypothetical protein